METKEKISFFNELTFDLNDETLFPADIYEKTRENPNPNASYICKTCNDSLDDYAKQLSAEILSALQA